MQKQRKKSFKDGIPRDGEGKRSSSPLGNFQKWRKVPLPFEGEGFHERKN